MNSPAGYRLRYHPTPKGYLLLGIATLLFFADGRTAFSEPPPSEESLIDGVPFYPQEELGCGPAAVASLLAYWGRPVSLEEITREVYLEKLKGSLPIDLERSAQTHGLAVSSYPGSMDDLRLHLGKNQPVIVFLNLRWRLFPQGHFVVVTGYDGIHSVVIVHSGDRAYERMPVDTFLNAWSKTGYWSLLILPPEVTS
ncbi:MAG TPA: C39 family peptidase [Nitrospiria bacterium]|jgi:ABC-type bacteriocin/lantibiotic exporter with double-glycine peptidase domain|nr:C39 family peptidase [Nitrospiria bacterium]